MDYNAIRNQIRTGDLIAFKSRRGLIAHMIRLFTRSQYTHTGVAIWLDGGLWLAEIQLGATNHLIPLSQMDNTPFDVFECPVSNDDDIHDLILNSLRPKIDYGLRSAITVGILRFLGSKVRPQLRQAMDCSDYCLSIYRDAGWDVPSHMVSPRDLTDMLVYRFSSDQSL